MEVCSKIFSSITLILLAISSTVFSQSNCNFTGNLGKSLSLFYDSCNSPGAIASGCDFYINTLNLSVACDDPNALALQIECDSDLGVAKVEILNSAKVPSDFIEKKIVELGNSKIKELTIALDTSMRHKFESYYVQITFSESRRRIRRSSNYRIFKLKKLWCGTDNCINDIDQSRISSANPKEIETFDFRKLYSLCPKTNAKITSPSESPEGISANRLDLNSIVDSKLVNVSKLLGVRYLYKDKNPKSGTFYWYPEKFSLSLNDKNELKANQIYTKTSTQEEKKIQFYAELSQGVTDERLESVKKILKTYTKSEEIKLQPLPIEDNIEFLSNWKQSYETTPFVSLRGSNLTDKLKIEFTADEKNMAKIGVSLLNGFGLSGDIKIKPRHEKISSITIPVEINLSPDIQALIKTNELVKGDRNKRYWVNNACHDLEVKTINFLVVEYDSNCKAFHKIYSWKLQSKEDKNTKVNGNGKLYIGFNSSIEKLLSEHKNIITRWLDISILANKECDKELTNQLVINPSQTSNSISIEHINLFSQIENLHKLIIKIRETSSKKKRVEEVVFEKGGTENKVVQGLFSNINSNTTKYEYSIELIDNLGNSYNSSWLSSSKNNLFIGTKLIKENVKTFKW